MSDDYFEERERLTAEGMNRRRHERRERRLASRRKTERALKAVAMALVLAVLAGYAAHARQGPDRGAVAVERGMSVPATTPPVSSSEATVVPALVTSTPVAAARPRAETEPARPLPQAAQAAPEPRRSASRPRSPSLQRARIAIGAAGYEPDVLTVKAGSPIEITVAKGEGCAAGFLMPDLGITEDNSAGPVTFRLPALDAGTYRFTCGMEMVEGRLVVR